MYEYVQVKSKGFVKSKVDYRDIVNKYSKEGFKFMATIPIESNSHGVVNIYDLVFFRDKKNIRYEYKYVDIKTSGKIKIVSNEYKTVIDDFEKDDFKFLTLIITECDGYGSIKSFDLVFEKEA